MRAALLLAVGLLAASGEAHADQAILIYGGADHRTFLGCLNCNEYDGDSVNNEYGSYGSPYSNTSIFNHYSNYGSPYSDTSPCNPYASDPPVLVDQDGGFYGYLTLNRYHAQAAQTGAIMGWLAGICR